MKIYNANGNRFIIGNEDIDVIKLCEKYKCDGYLKVNGYHFEVFNSDGSTANLCGNGLHCVTRYLYEEGIKSNKYTLVINNIDYETEILSIEPFTSRIKLKYPKVYKNFIDMGNKHLVLFEGIENAEEYCKRYDCNVHFVNVINRNCIEVVTYERGVGFTLSCGSGNSASAVYCYENGLCDSHIHVVNKGGECEIVIDKELYMTTTSHYERTL